MREAELLNALGIGGDGIQLTIRYGKVTLDTGFRPFIRVEGKTILEVAWECGRRILTRRDEYAHLPSMLAALDAYDQHTDALQL